MTTKNNGGAPAGSSHTWLCFSDDSKYSEAADCSGNRKLADIDVGPLAAGATDVRTRMVTIPADAAVGTRYLIGVADALKQIVEANERNSKPKAIAIQ